MREVRDWGVLCVCVREKSAETKEAAAAFNVPVVCPSPKPQAETTSPPPLSLSPSLALFHATHGGDEEEIPERGNRLRYSLEVEDLEGKSFPSLGPGVPPPSSSPHTHYYTSSGVARCGFGVGDITQNKGVLERGMSEPRLASPQPLKAGQMPL